MRKIKKINGYLVVKFNDRELREWEGTALGNYGVIDAELYTGCLEVDRGAMEYDATQVLSRRPSSFSKRPEPGWMTATWSECRPALWRWHSPRFPKK